MEIKEFCKKINAVPMSVIEDIKAEIKELPYQRIFGSVSSYSLLDTVIEIIDKHISGEEQERSE